MIWSETQTLNATTAFSSPLAGEVCSARSLSLTGVGEGFARMHAGDSRVTRRFKNRMHSAVGRLIPVMQ
jgi:hypothetical protein